MLLFNLGFHILGIGVSKSRIRINGRRLHLFVLTQTQGQAVHMIKRPDSDQCSSIPDVIDRIEKAIPYKSHRIPKG